MINHQNDDRQDAEELPSSGLFGTTGKVEYIPLPGQKVGG
jgi:hypothetical protein